MDTLCIIIISNAYYIDSWNDVSLSNTHNSEVLSKVSSVNLIDNIELKWLNLHHSHYNLQYKIIFLVELEIGDYCLYYTSYIIHLITN